MATTDISAEKHHVITIFLYKAVYKTVVVPKSVMRLIEMGLIQTDRLYEMYEAIKMKTTVVSTKGQDLESGHECKLRTLVRSENKKTGQVQHQASLTKNDLKNKTGNILLGVVNHFTGTFDRLEIPHEVYSKYVTLAISHSTLGKGYGKFEQYVLSREAYT